MTKKNLIWIYALLLGVFLIFTNSCKKDDNNSPSDPINVKNTAIFNSQLTYGTMIDQDGNTYKTVKIGTQTWLAENLKVTKFNDGTAIPLVTSVIKWRSLSNPAYCWYDNDEANCKNTYGALYNWHTVNTGKLCPTGWHVPTDAEWSTLISYLGNSVAGGKLKETDTIHWSSPNTGADNSSGFTALPSGYRFGNGTFGYFGQYGGWWSYTEDDNSGVWTRSVGYDNNDISRDGRSRTSGFSVRCVKDN